MNQLPNCGELGPQKERLDYLLGLCAEVLDTTRVPTSMGLNHPKLLQMLTPSKKVMGTIFWCDAFKKEMKICMLPLTSLQITSCHHQIISTFAVTWSLVSKRKKNQCKAWIGAGEHAYNEGPSNPHLCQHCFPTDCISPSLLQHWMALIFGPLMLWVPTWSLRVMKQYEPLQGKSLVMIVAGRPL